MYYKIYFENKPVFLLDAMDQELAQNLDNKNILYVNELSDAAVQQTLSSIRSDAADVVIFFHKNLRKLQEAFWKQFTCIQAAGGLVRNEHREVLCIFRLGRWDLPKGKHEQDESLEECAVREVQEETGLERIHLEKHLLTTYHTYRQDGKDILKETYWYEMTAGSNSPLVAQTEEDIHQVEWIAKDNLQKVLGNTYQAIKDVLAASAVL